MTTFKMETQEIRGQDKQVYVNIHTGRVMESKSQASTTIFREEQKNEDGEGSLRKRYMARVIAELGMSKPGASTYYYNELEQDRGGYKYKHNKNSTDRKNAAEAAKKEATETQAPTVEAPVQQDDVEVHRWQVVLKDTRELVESFTGRKAAQDFNKDQKAAGKQTVMIDGNKAA